MKKIILSSWLLLLASVMMQAQTTGFAYTAPLSGNTTAGFYTVVLQPELTAHLKTDISDLRIVNDSGRWIPHLIRTPNRERAFDAIDYNFDIVENRNRSTTTELIVQTGKTLLQQLVFHLRNTTAKRYCRLSGSDDQNKWFVINDSVYVEPVAEAAGSTKSFFSISFPSSDYRFYKLQVLNGNNESYNLLSVSAPVLPSTFFTDSLYHPAITNPLPRIIQKDSGNFTYVRIEQPAAYHFDNISLRVSGMAYYRRNAELYIPFNEQHSFNNPGRLLSSFSISNNSNLSYDIPVQNARVFYLLIRNDDNPPLKIDVVKTSIQYRVVTVYLETSKQYRLLLHNPTIASPVYDLSLNDISRPETTRVLTTGSITTLPAVVPQQTAHSSPGKMIWLLIAAAAIVLGFFTYRLVKDMNKNS